LVKLSREVGQSRKILQTRILLGIEIWTNVHFFVHANFSAVCARRFESSISWSTIQTWQFAHSVSDLFAEESLRTHIGEIGFFARADATHSPTKLVILLKLVFQLLKTVASRIRTLVDLSRFSAHIPSLHEFLNEALREGKSFAKGSMGQ